MHAAGFSHRDENAHIVEFEAAFDALDIIHDGPSHPISKLISCDQARALLARFGLRYPPAFQLWIILESHHETSSPPISASCSRGCHATSDVAGCADAILSVAAGAVHRGRAGGRRDRHYSAYHWALARGAPWPAIRYREPAGRRRQHRGRDRCPWAVGWSHALPGDAGERHQRDAL